jgi:hypothetical protein
VQTKLAPGQSTDGAVFYSLAAKAFPSGTLRVSTGDAVFEFPVLSSN